MLTKEYIMSYRVYFEDTDLMGIMYHARYLCFFDRARTDMLRAQGVSLTSLAHNDTYFAIRDIQIRYHFPARLDDTLNIISYIEQKKACTLQFKQIMLNQSEQRIAEATVLTVIVDQNLKPKRIPDKLIGG